MSATKGSLLGKREGSGDSLFLKTDKKKKANTLGQSGEAKLIIR